MLAKVLHQQLPCQGLQREESGLCGLFPLEGTLCPAELLPVFEELETGLIPRLLSMGMGQCILTV